MREERDFVQDRLVPFFIGLGVSVGFSVLYVILYNFAFALTIAGGFWPAQAGSPVAAIIGAPIAVPLWLLILAAGLAFWLLTTWLLGKWTQEKYHAWKGSQSRRRTAREGREREAWFAAKRREEAAEKQFQQEAEWEKEWIMMKKQEKENFSSEKQEKSASSNMDMPAMTEAPALSEEKQ